MGRISGLQGRAGGPTVGLRAASATLRFDGFGRLAAHRGSPVKVRRWPATVGETRPRKPGNLSAVSPTNRRGKRGLGTGTAAVSQRFSGSSIRERTFVSAPALRTAGACLVAALLGLGTAAVPVASPLPLRRGLTGPVYSKPTPRGMTAAAAGAGWIARGLNGERSAHRRRLAQTQRRRHGRRDFGPGRRRRWCQAGQGRHRLARAALRLLRLCQGRRQSGTLGLVVLSAVAAGGTRRARHEASSNDLVARLEAIEQLKGASAGVFGATSSGNTFSQSLAVLALVSVKGPATAIRLAQAYLASRQCTDGGWEYSLTTPCKKADPKSYAGPTPTRRHWPSWRSWRPAGTLRIAH